MMDMGGAINLIHGGWPCQPFSVAGERRGEEDDRHLWPEVKRLLQDIKPEWFVGENVAGHITLGLDEVLSNLEGCGYTWETFVIPAFAVNAPHRRDRIFIVGHLSNSSCIGHQGIERLREDKGKIREWRKSALRTAPKLFDDVDWKERARESGFLGRSDVVPDRMDRIKSLGNAVAPAQIYPILASIKQIDDMLRSEAA